MSFFLLQAFELKSAHALWNEYCPGDSWMSASLDIKIPKVFKGNFIRNDEESFYLLNPDKEPIYLLKNDKDFHVCMSAKDFKNCVKSLKSKSGMQRVNRLNLNRNFRFDFEKGWIVMERLSITVDGNCSSDCEIKSETISVSNFLHDFRENDVEGKSLYESYQKEGPGRPKDIQIPKNRKGVFYLEKESKEYQVPYEIKLSLNKNYDPKKESHSGKCQ